MIDLDRVAVAAAPLGVDDPAVAGGVDEAAA
jgi:hypothetical protein